MRPSISRDARSPGGRIGSRRSIPPPVTCCSSPSTGRPSSATPRAAPHKEKPAYATTVETSVYVDGEHRGRRVGHALYAALLERLDASGLRLAVAGVALPNDASERLHRAHGFREIGVFEGVGVKHGRAWDVRWFQRPLAGAPAL